MVQLPELGNILGSELVILRLCALGPAYIESRDWI